MYRLKGQTVTSLDDVTTTLTVINPTCEQLQEVGNLVSLRFLDISSRRSLDFLEVLRPLKDLQYLNLSKCRYLKDIEVIRNFEHMMDLNLSKTSVSSLEPLRDLKELGMLNISSTKVSDVGPILRMRSLAMVAMTGCLVNSYHDVDILKKDLGVHVYHDEYEDSCLYKI